MSATKKPEIVALKEKAAKLLAEQQTLDNDTIEILRFTVASNDREKEVITLMNQRMAITEMIENVQAQITAHDRNEKRLSKPEILAIKAQKKSLFDKLNALPDLGVTQAEWDETPADFKQKRIGRPAVSLEQRIIRARVEFEKTMERINEISNGTVDFDEITQMSQDSSVIEKKNGRPKHDALGNLDTQLKTIQGKIHYITSGDYQRHVDQRLKDSIYSGNGKRLGRSFESADEKLLRLRAEEARIISTISAAEANLSGDAKDSRDMKVLRDRRNSISAQIDASTSPEMKRALNAELDTVLETLSVIEARVKATKPTNGKLKPAHAKDYVAVDVTGIAQNPLKVVESVKMQNREVELSSGEDHANEHAKQNEMASRRLEAVRNTEETRESVTRLISRKTKS